MEGFEEFWAAYPRREAKRDAQKAWQQMNEDQRFAAKHAIGVHARYWDMSGRERRYIPLPATWLRGQRWEDEIEPPQDPTMGEWWKTTAGITRKALQLGVTPKPGEEWHELKARILARMKAA